MSDGSDRLRLLDPATFAERRRIQLTAEGFRNKAGQEGRQGRTGGTGRRAASTVEQVEQVGIHQHGPPYPPSRTCSNTTPASAAVPRLRTITSPFSGVG